LPLPSADSPDIPSRFVDAPAAGARVGILFPFLSMESDNPHPDQLQSIAEEAVDRHCPQRASIHIHELMHTSMRDLMESNVVTTPLDVENAASEIGGKVEMLFTVYETRSSGTAAALNEAVANAIRAVLLRRMPSCMRSHEVIFENVSAGQEPPLTRRSKLFPAQRSGPLGGQSLR